MAVKDLKITNQDITSTRVSNQTKNSKITLRHSSLGNNNNRQFPKQWAKSKRP